jgi:hypothetical protein
LGDLLQPYCNPTNYTALPIRRNPIPTYLWWCAADEEEPRVIQPDVAVRDRLGTLIQPSTLSTSSGTSSGGS